MMEKNRMGFPGVRSPQQNDVGVFNFAIRAGAAARPEYRRQTGDAGSVSSPVAAVDVIRTHDAADELLRRVIQLVGGLGAAEHAEVPRIVPRNRLAKRRGHPVHSFIPGSWTM